MSIVPPPSAVPVVSHWQAAQRHALRSAAQATPAARRRSEDDHTRVVLLRILANIAPASFRPGQLAAETGLTPRVVMNALADLEDAGLLEPGSTVTGRPGVLVPAVLDVLGVGGCGLALDVRPDERGPGPGELSTKNLENAFSGRPAVDEAVATRDE